MSAGTALSRPWLEMRLAEPCQVLSHTLNRPGFHTASRLLWREVRNADLPEDHDVAGWLSSELAARGASDAPCFLTSRNISRFVEVEARAEGIAARCVATLGLSNAERVGAPRMDYSGRDWSAKEDPIAATPSWGTINIAVECSLPMAPPALIEALTIMAQARTAALIEHGPAALPFGPIPAQPAGPITGTGTDCLAIAAPEGTERFAGLHTPQAEAIGRAVYEAIAQATRDWIAEQ